MDPLPRLAARVFDAAPEAPEFAPRHIRTRAGKLNLRAAPDTSSNVLAKLDAGSILKASALRGDWLRVTTPGNVSGWIHTAYQGEVSTLGRWPAIAQMPLLDSLSSQARPVALVDANGEKEGWIAGPIAGPATSVLVAGSDSGADDETAAGGGSSGAFE
jgi:hypothetical protein